MSLLRVAWAFSLLLAGCSSDDEICSGMTNEMELNGSAPTATVSCNGDVSSLPIVYSTTAQPNTGYQLGGSELPDGRFDALTLSQSFFENGLGAAVNVTIPTSTADGTYPFEVTCVDVINCSGGAPFTIYWNPTGFGGAAQARELSMTGTISFRRSRDLPLADIKTDDLEIGKLYRSTFDLDNLELEGTFLHDSCGERQPMAIGPLSVTVTTEVTPSVCNPSRGEL